VYTSPSLSHHGFATQATVTAAAATSAAAARRIYKGKEGGFVVITIVTVIG
jgi:hypothetical protein